nr:beta-CASP ribonuclease aCPSF1 [Nanoarchaeum sp.]
MVEEKTTDLFEKVKSNLPDDAKISDIRFEGCEIVLYTKSKDFFVSDSSTIKDLVSSLKKRIILRPDPSICTDMEKATENIKKLIPEEAGLKDLDFEPEFGSVTIEAEKPGLVIGKGGETLKEIRKQTLWLPTVKRAPVIPSDVVKVLRDLIHKESAFRKEFLDKVGKHIHSGWKTTDWIRLTALGGFREVGRSALLLQT